MPDIPARQIHKSVHYKVRTFGVIGQFRGLE